MTAARPKNHEWLALTTEAPLEPDLPICDPHHHLWDGAARVHRRATCSTRSSPTRGAGHNMVSTVFIECGAMFKADGRRPCAPSARPSSSTASPP